MEDWPVTEPPPALDCEPVGLPGVEDWPLVENPPVPDWELIELAGELPGVEDWPLLGTIFVTDCEAVELAGVELAGAEDWTGGLSLLGTTADDDDGDRELLGDWTTVELPVCDCDKTEDAGAWLLVACVPLPLWFGKIAELPAAEDTGAWLVADWLTVDDVGDAWLFVDCWFPPVDVATDWTLVL